MTPASVSGPRPAGRRDESDLFSDGTGDNVAHLATYLANVDNGKSPDSAEPGRAARSRVWASSPAHFLGPTVRLVGGIGREAAARDPRWGVTSGRWTGRI